MPDHERPRELAHQAVWQRLAEGAAGRPDGAIAAAWLWRTVEAALNAFEQAVVERNLAVMTIPLEEAIAQMSAADPVFAEASARTERALAAERAARMPTALQRIGCEHPVTVQIGTFGEPHVHRCQNPNCLAEWQETEWRRRRVWA